MNGAFYIGATGLRSQQSALDVIANNIANINTPAFKRSEVRFSELVTPLTDSARTDLAAPDLASLMAGVSMTSSPRVFEQGDLRQTDKPLDIAISGDGLIELMGPAGQTMLWRGGSLKVNADGYLAAENGMPLKAMIAVPQGTTALTIERDGTVRAQGDGESPTREIGQIDLVQPRDMDELSGLGGGLFKPDPNAELVALTPGEDGGGVLIQGSIEASNVDLAQEMVTLLLLQRAYAANAQVIQAGDQLMGIANGLKR